jgi:hypothetical protein
LVGAKTGNKDLFLLRALETAGVVEFIINNRIPCYVF